MKPSLDWLLVFVPAAIVLHFAAPGRDTLVFGAAAIGIVPLAGWLGHATEDLARRTSVGLGGLLNPTFSHAGALISAFAALNRGLHDGVQASLTGTVLCNVPLGLRVSVL